MKYKLILGLAIGLEVAGTISMKLSDGFSKLVPSILIFVFYAASFAALTFTLKKIEISVAYAVWSGVGTALIATIGILYFKEAATTLKFVSLFLIVAGVVGLKIGSAT
ncbi:MAG: multidrug efflux SMR transporter [Rickettsiales bacterium]